MPITRDTFQPTVERLVTKRLRSGTPVDTEIINAMAVELDTAVDQLLSGDGAKAYDGIVTIATIAAMLRRCDVTGQFVNQH